MPVELTLEMGGAGGEFLPPLEAPQALDLSSPAAQLREGSHELSAAGAAVRPAPGLSRAKRGLRAPVLRSQGPEASLRRERRSPRPRLLPVGERCSERARRQADVGAASRRAPSPVTR